MKPRTLLVSLLIRRSYFAIAGYQDRSANTQGRFRARIALVSHGVEETDEWQNWIGEAMSLKDRPKSSKEKSNKANSIKKLRGPVFAKIIKEASDHVEVYGKQIVESLYDSVLVGNASSARLLIDLAVNQEDEVNEIGQECLVSMADKLAKEDQWVGEQEEVSVDTCSSVYEAEG